MYFNKLNIYNMSEKTFREQLTFKNTVLGVQFLFVAFGATVLVPLLVGIDPAVALFTAGIGTLLFHLITRGIVPVFLGSSFAFIAPIIEATKIGQIGQITIQSVTLMRSDLRPQGPIYTPLAAMPLHS